MPRRLSPLLAAAGALALLLAPSALGAGLPGNRALTPVAKAAASASPLIAPEASCPGQDDLRAPAEAQEQTMLCMTAYARAAAGLTQLAAQPALAESATAKARDVLSCDSFSHFACDREFTYWMSQTGYTSVPCWHVGENLAWGAGEYGSPGSIFRAWMRSPTHRQNILGDYGEVGIGLQVGNLEGRPGARVWASHFGTQCDAEEETTG